MSSQPKTIAFFGASTGVGLSALKHSLAAGHRCIALCRQPSKLEAVFPSASTPNLTIIGGNAHDVVAVSKCLQVEDGKLVDIVCSTIGSRPVLHKLTVEDPECCRKGAATLLDALDQLKKNGATGNPHIISFSTTGMSKFGRDVPYAMIPLYWLLLKVPHEDKRIMEDRFAESGRPFTVVRASMLVDGESSKDIRVGVEDPKTGRESNAIGYTISREDSGKWVADNLILRTDAGYLNKIVTITY